MKGEIKPIIVYGSDMLNQVSEPVKEMTLGIEATIANLIETCANIDIGVGLSAPQIGLFHRLIIGVSDQVFINPIILESKGGTKGYNEGCLSIPGVYGTVHRPQKIRLSWLDENWKKHEKTFKGFEGRVIQLLIDRLDGRSFTSRMNPHNYKLVKPQLQPFEKGEFDIKAFKKYPLTR